VRRAAEVEALVGQAVREHLKVSALPDGDLIRAHVARVDVQADHLAIELRAPKQGQSSGKENGTPPSRESGQLEEDRIVLRVPWKKPPLKRRREIIVPQSAAPQDARPIRAETRATLVASIARGRRWLDEIVAGAVSVDQCRG
jgi:site-specific DNA recombinase